MARERNSSKIRDLEGENRNLRKQVRMLEREVSRLQKTLRNQPDSPTEDFIEEYDNKEDPVCPECGSQTQVIKFSDLSNKTKDIIVCKNIDCRYRGRVHGPG